MRLTNQSRTFATLVLMAAVALFLTFNTTQARAGTGGETSFAQAIVPAIDDAEVSAAGTTSIPPGFRAAPNAVAAELADLNIAVKVFALNPETRDYINPSAWRQLVTQGGNSYGRGPAWSARGSTSSRQLRRTLIGNGYLSRPRGSGLTVGSEGGDPGDLSRAVLGTSGEL